MKKVVWIALAALLFIGASNCMKAQETDTPAPDFTLKDLQGRTISLSSYKGKVLLLNFWATWCPPCRQEIPDFIEAYKEYKDNGLEILGVSVDSLSLQKLTDWVASASINYPVALATRDVVMDYKPGDFIPASIFIDREGRIRYKHVGAMDKETLLRLFQKYSR